MIVLASLILGALVGWFRGRALRGNAKDVAWYAAAHALIFALGGILLTVLLLRASG